MFKCQRQFEEGRLQGHIVESFFFGKGYPEFCLNVRDNLKKADFKTTLSSFPSFKKGYPEFCLNVKDNLKKADADFKATLSSLPFSSDSLKATFLKRSYKSSGRSPKIQRIFFYNFSDLKFIASRQPKKYLLSH